MTDACLSTAVVAMLCSFLAVDVVPAVATVLLFCFCANWENFSGSSVAFGRFICPGTLSRLRRLLESADDTDGGDDSLVPESNVRVRFVAPLPAASEFAASGGTLAAGNDACGGAGSWNPASFTTCVGNATLLTVCNSVSFSFTYSCTYNVSLFSLYTSWIPSYRIYNSLIVGKSFSWRDQGQPDIVLSEGV